MKNSTALATSTKTVDSLSYMVIVLGQYVTSDKGQPVVRGGRNRTAWDTSTKIVDSSGYLEKETGHPGLHGGSPEIA